MVCVQAANAWRHRRGDAHYAAAPGGQQARRAWVLRGCSLKGLLQAIGLWRKEIRYLPRRIPMDGTLSAAAAVARGARAGEDVNEGLAAALAIRNVVRNQKYRAATFIFAVLYEQFRYFFNLYFLLVALSQLIPELQVGFLFTYIAPLVFVLSITLAKEASDDYQRYVRDKESNSQRYDRLMGDGRLQSVPSSDIKVGDVILMPAGARVPADMVLLRTTDKSGAVFIRTDQLDGETDWKLRSTIAQTQGLPSDEAMCRVRATVYADAPSKEIDQFVGTFTLHAILRDPSSSSHSNGDSFVVVDPGSESQSSERERARAGSSGRMGTEQVGAEVEGGQGHTCETVEPLNIDNTLWANTVVCGGGAVGLVVYTGTETRVAMNCDPPKSKVGLVDLEINRLAKMLFMVSLVISVTMVSLKGWSRSWPQSLMRFIILFSSIIPISLRVNIDMAKSAFSYFMMRDDEIPGTIVRSSFIPEELGRIDYLLSDKTGTLTQNVMEMKEIHMGELSFGREALEEVRATLKEAFMSSHGNHRPARGRMAPSTMLRRLIEALALCHNVNVTMEGGQEEYQASSPDEVALVKYARDTGLVLTDRSTTSMVLTSPSGDRVEYQILYLFPFSSDTKRMGIIVREPPVGGVGDGRILFLIKGADAVMAPIVEFSDWLEEECGNLARKGLRTLVLAMRVLSKEEFLTFSQRYEAAKRTLVDRDASMRTAIEDIECNLELLGLTGVEDKLQDQVRETLATLRNAGVRVWMLTGDKVETATCIAMSANLFARNAPVFHITANTKEQAEEQFQRFQKKPGACLVIDGRSLSFCTDNFPVQFLEVAMRCPSVVCCRCAPTQKALIVRLLKRTASKRCAAIGDGGNDVAMIQAADTGIGIEGKEGKQASLAADFSITKFKHVSRLMLWHGRNSYTRTARLSQFVIHRGLIISIIQVVFSAIFYFNTIAIYSGWLVVGYSTLYTMFPVFSLVFDEDVDADTAFMYPELYKELQKGRRLCTRTFLEWTLKSIYQGASIMLLSIYLFDNSFLRIISITFTSLVLTELLMVALEVQKWQCLMVAAQFLSLACYMMSFLLLPTYFDVGFIFTWKFWSRVSAITLVPSSSSLSSFCLHSRTRYSGASIH